MEKFKKFKSIYTSYRKDSGLKRVDAFKGAILWSGILNIK